MSFDQAAVNALVNAAVSHAEATGAFRSVVGHEPKAAPGSGLRAAVWVQHIRPIAASGLAATSGVVTLSVRAYLNMLTKPEDDIDPQVLAAASLLMDQYTGDFTFGGTVRHIDLLGMYGEQLEADFGYLNIADTMYRQMTLTVPCVINDLWVQGGIPSAEEVPGRALQVDSLGVTAGASIDGALAAGSLTVDGAAVFDGTAAFTGSATADSLTVTGNLTVDGTFTTPGAVNTGGVITVDGIPAQSPAITLPAGYGNSTRITGLQVASSYPSDDVSGGTDGTGRLSLYSFQRANAYSFGETIRNFLMRRDAKAMTAWYSAVSTGDSTDGYDHTSRYPLASGITWSPVIWTGAHGEANDHASLHMHWEVEAADALGELQGRLTILYGDPTTGVVGLNKTIVGTNCADFHFQAFGSYSDGTSAEQYFRIMAPAGHEKPIEWNNAGGGHIDPTAFRRWKLFATSDTETGANAGTNFALNYYDDGGNLLGSPIRITRATGQILLGGSSYASPVLIEGNAGVALQVTPLSTGGQAILVTGTDATARAYEANVTGEAAQRYVILTDGSMTWGDGTNPRDTNLYRSAANLLRTDDSFQAPGIGIGTAPSSLQLTAARSTAGQVAQFSRTSTSDASPVVLILTGDTSTASALALSVNGDASNRFAVDPTGIIGWGSGTASRDVTLFRSAAGVLQTAGSLHAGTNLRLNTTSLGGGTGVLAMANATTPPGITPTGGGVLYVSGGALLYKGSSGTVTTLATA